MQHSKWNLKYDLTESRVATEEGASGTVYGLACIGSHPGLERAAVLATISDISGRRDFVTAMAQLFTIGSLPPERLSEAVTVLL